MLYQGEINILISDGWDANLICPHIPSNSDRPWVTIHIRIAQSCQYRDSLVNDFCDSPRKVQIAIRCVNEPASQCFRYISSLDGVGSITVPQVMADQVIGQIDPGVGETPLDR